MNGFSQLINEPTHIQTNNSSCTDLIFTDQSMVSVNSGVHTSLHPNWCNCLQQTKAFITVLHPGQGTYKLIAIIKILNISLYIYNEMC